MRHCLPDVLLSGGQGSPSPGPQVPQGGAQSTTLPLVIIYEENIVHILYGISKLTTWQGKLQKENKSNSNKLQGIAKSLTVCRYFVLLSCFLVPKYFYKDIHPT